MTNAPTDKQIAYLATLWKCDERDVDREVAKRWNCSPSSARRRLTKQDVSRFIEEAKQSLGSQL